jgi:hypothetical protein
MLSPPLERLITHCAKLFSLIAWTGLVYDYVRHSEHVSIGERELVAVPMNIFSVVTLFTGLVSMLCGIHIMKDEISDPKAWIFCIWCSAPFLLIVGLLNPMGAR